jgi:hypothetical protein
MGAVTKQVTKLNAYTGTTANDVGDGLEGLARGSICQIMMARSTLPNEII